MSFSILGAGSALPSCVKTNDDLAQILDTSDQWIYTRTGIRRRHVITTETITGMAAEAARKALAAAGITPEDLDYIVCRRRLYYTWAGLYSPGGTRSPLPRY